MAALRSLLLTAGPLLLLLSGTPSAAVTPAGVSPGAAAGPERRSRTGPSDARLALAERLSRSGAVFYGAWWCPHCQHQKDLFGRLASPLIPYVECDRDDAGRRRCQQAEVRAYPTWVIGKERREGLLSLDELQAWLDSVTPGSRPSAAPATSP